MVRTIYIPFGLTAYTNFFANRTLRLGNPEDLERALELWSAHNLFERLPRLVNGVLLTVLAVFLLALYFTQKGHIEYLWLALHELVQAPIGFIDLAGSSARLDQIWYAALVLQLVVISAYLYFEFLIAFLVAASGAGISCCCATRRRFWRAWDRRCLLLGSHSTAGPDRDGLIVISWAACCGSSAGCSSSSSP